MPLNSNSKSRQEVKRDGDGRGKRGGGSLVRWERRCRSDKGWIPCFHSLTARIEQSSPICLVGWYTSQCASWKGSFQRQELKCFIQVTVDRPRHLHFKASLSRQHECGLSESLEATDCDATGEVGKILPYFVLFYPDKNNWDHLSCRSTVYD